jgi:hypothetical protein
MGINLKIILISYGPLIIVTFISLIPDLNLFFLNGHGGPGILFILLSWPWTVFYLFKNIRKREFTSVRKYYLYIVLSLLGYLILSYPAAIPITNCKEYLGSNSTIVDNWILLNFPFLLILNLFI